MRIIVNAIGGVLLIALQPTTILATDYSTNAAPYFYAPANGGAASQNPNSANYGQYGHYQQGLYANNNQLKHGQWQQGKGNIFQDAKGFYKLMGNGKTKWKFYFDVDFQAQMDAWMRANGKANGNVNNRQNFNGQGQPHYYGNGYYQQYHRYYSQPYTAPALNYRYNYWHYPQN